MTEHHNPQMTLRMTPESSAETDELSTTHAMDKKLRESVDDGPQISMRIIFKDLTYVVRNQANKNEKLALLKGISGFYLPGEMAAVMGPSGSGAFFAFSYLLSINFMAPVLMRCGL